MATPMTAAERKRKQRKRDHEDPERKQRKLDTLYMFGCVEIAVIVDEAGEIWFKGVDLARALEMEDPNNAICVSVDIQYTKSYEEILDSFQYRDIPGMHPKTTFVNETGMNMFVLRSRKPKAEAFAEWVCGVVLPSIRKTGKFEVNERDNPYRELSEVYKKRLSELEIELTERKIELKNKDAEVQNLHQTVELKNLEISKTMGLLFNMKPTCVPPLANEMKQEYVMIIRTATTENVKFPYYALRRQEDTITEAYKVLKETYPVIVLKLSTPNSVNFFNYILEKISDDIVRWRVNMFYLAPGVSEEDFILKVENLYRTSYGKVPPPR